MHEAFLGTARLCLYSGARKTFFSADDSKLKNVEKAAQRASERRMTPVYAATGSSILKALPGSSEFNSFFSLSVLHHIANKNFIAQLSCCWRLKMHERSTLFIQLQADHHEIRERIKSEREERDPKKRLRSTHELSEKEEKESNWY